MLVNIASVVPGDTILEGHNSRIAVKKVEVYPGSCKTKVHINGNLCYEGFTEVKIQKEKPKDDAAYYDDERVA
ncbi:MAG: hypothetical protein JWO15_3516 [Sphingomonadales bacterium]|nr:hypothetical protein [Sphingomonadales bacterium]